MSQGDTSCAEWNISVPVVWNMPSVAYVGPHNELAFCRTEEAKGSLWRAAFLTCSNSNEHEKKISWIADSCFHAKI